MRRQPSACINLALNIIHSSGIKFSSGQYQLSAHWPSAKHPYFYYVQQNSVRSFLPHTTLLILLQTQSCLFCVRLTFSDPPPSRSSSLLRMGSKFRYSDRTLYQLHKDGQPIKDQPKFNRVSSLNWSRRYQMPSLSETRIYVKEDDESNKRPLSEGDLPGKMRWYKGGQVS